MILRRARHAYWPPRAQHVGPAYVRCVPAGLSRWLLNQYFVAFFYVPNRPLDSIGAGTCPWSNCSECRSPLNGESALSSSKTWTVLGTESVGLPLLCGHWAVTFEFCPRSLQTECDSCLEGGTMRCGLQPQRCRGDALLASQVLAPCAHRSSCLCAGFPLR